MLDEPILLGTSFFGQSETAFPVYDEFWQRGGRAFDTARVYGAAFGGPGLCERVLGEWLKTSGAVGYRLLTKGAHTPQNWPEMIRGEMEASFSDLGVDYSDVHLVHRDNPLVPVGEFVDALSALMREGRIGGYGFSNWSLLRVMDACNYAAVNNLPLPSCVSNQFSLCDMVKPIYEGVETSHTDDWRDWLATPGTPDLIPWASQGRGVHALSPTARLSDSPLSRSWGSKTNEGRILRAKYLGEKYGVSGTQIALAWTIWQPHTVRPIVGSRSQAEVRDSLCGSTLKLSPEELSWLEHGTRSSNNVL